MDLINNLVFTALNQTGSGTPIPALTPSFVNLPTFFSNNKLPLLGTGPNSSYHINIKEEFCAFDDSDFVEDAIQKHWADMVNGRDYFNPADTNNVYSLFREAAAPFNLIPPYHLIYAYLVENTRCTQIFERLIYMYMHDEKLNKATTVQDRLAFQWIVNTENLFFKYLSNTSYRNITSQVRQSPDATRRNAYFRLLGMDLAFGDMGSNAPVNFYKAESNNQPFIVLFEKFLTEIWQAYTNANNQIGPNTTDLFVIVDTAQKIQEMLMARRTTETTFENYRYFNLSKEEYAAVVMMSWLNEVVSYDSPIVHFLRCNGNTPGERLINIGNKVGLQAHSKSEGLLDIAPPMNTLLRRVELGDYNNESTVTNIIKSQANNLPLNSPERQALNDLLLIINNWEKATGHAIKNARANITGTVSIQQNGSSRPQVNGVMPKPVMN